MMHDIISDVLTADTIPHDRKRQVIYAQLDELRDSTRNVMTWGEWRNMGEMMGGVAVMGGPATGIIEGRPTPAPPAAGMHHGRHAPDATNRRDEKADSGNADTHHRQPNAPAAPQPADSAAHGEAHPHPQGPGEHEGHR